MTLYEKVKHLLAEGFEVGEIAFSLGISCDLVQRVKNLMEGKP